MINPAFNNFLIYNYSIITFFIIGNYYVSLGPPYVLARLSCQSKQNLSHRQRIQVSSLKNYLMYLLLFPFHLYSMFSFLQYSVMGYTLLLSLIEYKTLVMRGDLERASGVLHLIPIEYHNRYHYIFCTKEILYRL